MTGRKHITDELKGVSKLLSGLDASNPYRVPAGYFDTLADSIMLRIRAEAAASPEEELELLSPFLRKLDKTPPYTVPQGYFENLATSLPKPAEEKQKEPAPVVRMSPRRVFSYAAAAVTVGLITIVAWFFIQSPAKQQTTVAANHDTLTERQMQKDISGLSDTEIASFVEGNAVADVENQVVAVQLEEEPFRLMLSEVSDEELEKYLEQQPVKEKFN